MERIEYLLKKLLLQNEDLVKRIEKQDKVIARIDRTLKRKKSVAKPKKNPVTRIDALGNDIRQLPADSFLGKLFTKRLTTKPAYLSEKHTLLRYASAIFKVNENRCFKLQNTYYKIHTNNEWRTVKQAMFYEVLLNKIWKHYKDFLDVLSDSAGWFRVNFPTLENPLTKIDMDKILLKF